MTFQRILDKLPEVYRNFLPRFFENNIPEETAATCADCAMWGGSKPAFPGRIHFSRDSKCCTHYPNLPNYLIGALLSNNNPTLKTGKRRIRQTIHNRIGVTPYGILRPKKFQFLLKSTESNFFGKSRLLICPFFEREKGICTIRPYWDAVCNTWFCKYIDGYDDMMFWITLRKYLVSGEETLAKYALYKMDWDPQKIAPEKSPDFPLTVEELDDQPSDQKTYQALWGEWVGREEDFYKKTYLLVSALTPKTFEKIGGISLRILLAGLKNRYRTRLKPRLPKKLKRNPNLKHEKISEDSYVLTGYSPMDPFTVSKRIYDILDFFDGKQSNEEVCRLVRECMGAEPDKELLTCLYQLRILVSNEEEDEDIGIK